MFIGLNLGLSRPVGRSGPSGPVVATVSPPSFDPAKLIVNKQIGLAYLPGSYTSPGVTVTEGTVAYLVNGISRPGTYVLGVSDTVARATAPLLLDAVASGQTATTGDVAVPAISITESTPSSFNTSLLVVGATLTSAYVAGTRTSPSGVITEGAKLYNGAGVGDVSGSHVIGVGDGPFTASIQLLVDGLDINAPDATIAATAVTNTPPVAGDVTSDITVPAGPTVGPSPFTVASDVYFKDLVNYPTADGKLTFEIDGEVSSVTGTPYLAEMDNSHIRLLCNQGNSSLYFEVKDSVNTMVRGSTLIGAIVLDRRFRFIASIDLGADTVITSWDNNYVPGVSTPTVVTHTVTASVSGILASAGRKMTLLGRAGGTALPSGTFRQMKVWNDFVPGGGIPADDTLLLADGYITGPAATANAHPWKLGAGSAT